MININYKILEKDKCDKNQLYKIEKSRTISYREEQSDDVVYLKYALKEYQYGIFAHEFRNPVILKSGNKAADILACVVDEKNKKICSLVLDVKHNISAFSDNLCGNDNHAMLTVIKNVRGFVEQIDAELLHKNSFILYYTAEGYKEQEQVGIATTNFDRDKFIQSANLLEELLHEPVGSNNLVRLKLKNNLSAYGDEVARIRLFADKKIEIRKKVYDLEVFILKKESNNEYSTYIRISDCM